MKRESANWSRGVSDLEEAKLRAQRRQGTFTEHLMSPHCCHAITWCLLIHSSPRVNNSLCEKENPAIGLRLQDMMRLLWQRYKRPAHIDASHEDSSPRMEGVEYCVLAWVKSASDTLQKFSFWVCARMNANIQSFFCCHRLVAFSLKDGTISLQFHIDLCVDLHHDNIPSC